MARPALEVANVFRDHGAAWRHANRGHVSLLQLKVMSAIESCRTAALGGHVARCENCAETIARTRELLGLATPVAEEKLEIDPATAQPLAQSCPCCGGRMFVIETFDAGCQPRHRPTAPVVEIRIDTS
jgi:Transposase zinc-binding domain